MQTSSALVLRQPGDEQEIALSNPLEWSTMSADKLASLSLLCSLLHLHLTSRVSHVNDTAAAAENSESSVPSSETGLKPLRTWPALILLGLMVVLRFIPSMVEDGPSMLWMSSAFGPLLCSIVVLLWWLTLSRSGWLERVLGFFGLVGVLAAAIALVDPSMRGPATMMLTIPLGVGGFVVGCGVFGRMLSIKRTGIALLLAIIGSGLTLGLRAEGIWGNFDLGLAWRWEPSAEQQLLADEANRTTVDIETMQSEQIDAGLNNPEWPEFRGARRDGVQRGTAWSSDWSQNPPQELWRIAVGPGWSSFVVAGNLCYTQEQRGDAEAIVCYEAETGAEVWKHTVEARFDDPLGGPGPRATPTLADGQLFAMGAMGHVLRLDPKTGERIWQVDLREVADRQPPMWGFSSSPLVTGQAVIVHAAGKKDLGIIAFDRETGDKLWSAASGEMSYSSPQLSEILGQRYVLMLTDTGLDLLDPETGEVVFQHLWPSQGYRALQPQVIGNDSVLLPTGLGHGTRLIALCTHRGQVDRRRSLDVARLQARLQ